MSVQGLAELNRRWSAIPDAVRQEVRKEMERTATELVAEMNSFKPLAEITISWTWGDAPKGSLVIGKSPKGSYGAMRITIYASGTDFDPKWFEFGTDDRFHESGKFVGRITASPFFFPIWRVRRRLVRGRISRAVSRAIKNA
ncbi:MAG: hypothetical protein JKY94_08045 [Rhodobacteraceae bacterium]|nr:hypothetical protein [Paracoccaceae bacterium]